MMRARAALPSHGSTPPQSSAGEVGSGRGKDRGWGMLTFLAVALTFPTLLYGLLLGVAMLYWLLAATGLIQIDLLDGLFDGDGGADSHSGEPGGITGPLMRFGLGGVPLSLSFTVLLLFAWLLSYFASVLVGGGAIGALTMGWGVRLAIFAGAFVGALPLTALSLRPARRFFAKLQPVPQASLLGMRGVVRSPSVTATQGTVSVEDGGAGLVLQVRDDTPGRFRRGDRVVLVEYLEDRNAYRVAAEQETPAP